MEPGKMYYIITHSGNIIHGRLAKIGVTGYLCYFYTETEEKIVLIDDILDCYYDMEIPFNNFHKLHPSRYICNW